jgi:hypothetical protein
MLSAIIRFSTVPRWLSIDRLQSGPDFFDAGSVRLIQKARSCAVVRDIPLNRT